MTDRLLIYTDLFVSMAMQYTPKVLLALITLMVGLRLVRLAVRIMERALSTQHIDRSLASFLGSLVSIFLKALLIMTVMAMVGIQMTSFIAILGAVGLAVGLSLQGSLANFAGGLLILFFKHFHVGEQIAAMGQKGTVEKIELFTTVLRGEDGSMIILPNGPLSNGVIVNFSRK